jgi:hypothetical protein
VRLGAADGTAPLDHLDPGLAELVQWERELKLRLDPRSGQLQARLGQDAPDIRVNQPDPAAAYRRAVSIWGEGRLHHDPA